MNKTDKDSGNVQAHGQIKQTQQHLAEVKAEQHMRANLGALLSLMSELSKQSKH
jgi:hypothetical protein